MSLSRGLKRKRTVISFKSGWLDETIETVTPKSHSVMLVKLREIFTYDEDNGVVCIYCQDARASGEFLTGIIWNDVWKLDFFKRHLSNKSHINGVTRLRNKNPSLQSGLLGRIIESPAEKQRRQINLERKHSNPEEIKVLIDSVLLAIKMNSSMFSVQDINDHLEKYVHVPASWRSKNYAFEFLEIINCIVQNNLMHEIASAMFHTLAVDENTDISINRYLIFYFKYRSINCADYKTSFGGLLLLQECDAVSIVSAIKQFYKKHQLDLMKMVMFTSDVASVMLGKLNGVAAQLKRDIPHLVQQHCIAHREDLGISDAWKEVKLIRDIETLMRTV
ncbi:unnamed protein product [Caretta caretta]